MVKIGGINDGGFPAKPAGPPSFAVVLALVTLLGAQSVPQNIQPSPRRAPKASPAETISSSAVWLPGPDFLESAHAACGHNTGRTLAECFISQMTKADAPRDAMKFCRQLYLEKGGEFGVMWRFQKLGPVDMTKVFYPLRTDDNYALLLVNGDPPIIDVDDLKKLDKHGLEQDEAYQLLKRLHPNLELWGGGRSGTMWDSVHKRADGGQSFDIVYLLNPVRPTSAWVSVAHFNWNFDANGKFLGTEFTGGVGPLGN